MVHEIATISYEELKNVYKKKDTPQPGNEQEHTVWSRVRKRGDAGLLEALQKEDVFCVQGQYDHIEKVLERLEIPHTVVPEGGEEALLERLGPQAVLIFNCTSHRDLDDAARRRLREFVSRGGYLFTSDWELRNTLEVALPGYVAQAGSTGDHEFAIQPAPGAAGNPYLRDVFPQSRVLAATMKWKIDGSSFTIRHQRKEAVPLITCDELGVLYGSKTVACTFKYDQGSVLHVLGHLEKQVDPKDDRFALLQLLVNFIVEKQRARQKTAP